MKNFQTIFKVSWSEISAVNEMSVLEAALFYSKKLGLPVLPVAPNAKNPYTKHGVYDATCDEQQIRKWFTPNQTACNLGLRCGGEVRLLVVDTDVKGIIDGYITFCAFCIDHDFDPHTTWHSQSPSGGVHFYFTLPQDSKLEFRNRVNLAKVGLEAVDIRTEGGYIVAPPSRIGDRKYHWLNKNNLPEIDLLPLPDFLAEALSKPVQQFTPEADSAPDLEAGAIKDVLQLVSNKTLRKMPNVFTQVLEDLLKKTCQTIATTPKGSRNNTLNIEALKIYRLFWTLRANKIETELQSEVTERLAQAARQAGEEEAKIQATLASAEKKANEDGAYKLPRKNGDQPSAKEIREAKLTKDIAQDPDQRERIDYNPAFCSTDSFLQKIEQLLMQHDAKIYKKDNRLVILLPNGDEDTADTESVHPLKPEHLNYWLGKTVIFVVEGNSGFRIVEVPDKLIDRILIGRHGHWAFNRLKGVFNAPTININTGELLTTPGYDPKTKYYFSFDPNKFDLASLEILQSLKSSELLQIAQIRFNLLKAETLGEFGFADAISCNTALAAILTGVIRKQLTSAPMFCFDSPTPGSGKSTLCQCIGLLTTGQIPTLMQYTQKEEEFEKRIVSLLLTEPSVICFDNVKGNFDSSSLSQILTTGTFDGRLLGKNEMIKLSTNALFLLNGNNLSPTKDIVRRLLVCRLDRQMARPEIYDYKEKNPLAFWREKWPDFYLDALLILKAYYDAGMPGSEAIEGRSYPQWARIVLGALQWCDLGEQVGHVKWENCPWLGQDKAFELDPDQEALAAVLQVWLETYQETPVFPKTLANEDNPVFKTMKSNFSIKDADAKIIGNCLKNHKDKICTIEGRDYKLCHNGAKAYRDRAWLLTTVS